MDWKEQLIDEIVDGKMYSDKNVIDFICKEIIEKIIDDIPEISKAGADEGIHLANDLKQQLKDKWL